MDNVKFNKCQTPLEELGLEKQPQEVQEPREYTVYRHISPSGRVYVGITKLPLSFRWNQGKGYKRCKLFYRAIQKYGWNNLQHCVVCSGLTKTEACLLEQHLICYYKSKNLSYNITDGGEGTLGCSMPDVAKKKISKFQKELHDKVVLQYTLSGEFIREFQSAREASQILGFGHTSVSNCASGLERENTLHGYIFIYKEDIESLPRRLKLCKDHWRKYKIVQYKENIIINIFDSIREAERITGINRVCIRKNISGIFKQAGKYTWKKVKEGDLYGNEIQ